MYYRYSLGVINISYATFEVMIEYYSLQTTERQQTSIINWPATASLKGM